MTFALPAAETENYSAAMVALIRSILLAPIHQSTQSNPQKANGSARPVRPGIIVGTDQMSRLIDFSVAYSVVLITQTQSPLHFLARFAAISKASQRERPANMRKSS